ncbi:MAG: glycosyltransferase, partial [Peptococcaceae bacterium]|nr:glycosyltransferase [Peptococcaceae bacterium]
MVRKTIEKDEEETMRVLLLSHMYPNPVSPLSGIFVQQQAHALVRLGVRVTVVAPVPWTPAFLSGRTKWGGYPALAEREMDGEIPVFRPRVLEFPGSRFFELYPWTYVRGMRSCVAEQMRRGVDLIHAHVAHPDGAAAVRFGREFAVPVVVTIHGQDFAYTLKRSKMCKRSVIRTLQAARRVVLVSDKLRSAYGLESWGGDLSKYRVIRNGFQSEMTEAADPAESERSDKREARSRVLLSVGFLRPDKGHAIVLRAFQAIAQEFPDVVYRIVGDGMERQRLEQLAADLGLSERVEFLGMLAHPLAMRQMAECDIFVMPSWNEAFGVVYLEAMAHGKPVIGTIGEGID